VERAWTVQARARLASAFARSGSPIGPRIAGETIRALDASTARWAALACRPQTDRERACASSHAVALAALLGVFERADRNTVEHAAAAVTSLGEPAACDAPARVIPDPLLAEAKALRVAGHYREAIGVLARDADRSAAVELELGVDATATGQLDRARDHLSRAVAQADAARDDRSRARALIATLSLLGDEAVVLDEARRIEDQARAAVERAGPTPGLRADLARAIGVTAIRRGQLADAAKALADAATLYRAAHDDIALAAALDALGGVHAELGDPAKALTELDEARQLNERAVGADHPNTGAAWSSMVGALAASGRNAEALDAARRAVAIYERALGPRDPKLAAAIENLAIMTSLTGDAERAIAMFERARRMSEELLGPDHVDLATSWLNLASANKAAGHLDAAAEGYRRAIAIWTRAQQGTSNASDIAHAQKLLRAVTAR